MKKPFNELKQDVLDMINECVDNETKLSVMEMTNLLEMGEWLIENYFWEEEDLENWLEISEFS